MTVDVFSARNIERQICINPQSTAILIVDMLNEFCKPRGAMVLPGYEKLVGPQNHMIKAGRQVGCPIIFVVDTHRANVRQDREWLKRTPHCVEGSWGAQIIDDLEPKADDIYVVKRRYSASSTLTST